LLTYDGLAGRWRTIRLARNPRCPVCADEHGRSTPTDEMADRPFSSTGKPRYGG